MTEKERMEYMLDGINFHLDENQGLMIEVPVNLLYILQEFLKASSWYADMNTSKVPYPSFENTAHLLSEHLGNCVHESHKKTNNLGSEPYMVYDLVSACDSETKLKNLINRTNNKEPIDTNNYLYKCYMTGNVNKFCYRLTEVMGYKLKDRPITNGDMYIILELITNQVGDTIMVDKGYWKLI